jgi:hypothetical protein
MQAKCTLGTEMFVLTDDDSYLFECMHAASQPASHAAIALEKSANEISREKLVA